MKKNLILGSTLLLIGLVLPTLSIAQNGADGQTSTQVVNMTVGGSSLIKVTGGAVGLNLSAGATQAGQSLQAISNNKDTRLRMSSLTSTVAETEVKNKITAELLSTSATLQNTHTKLYLRLLAPNASNIGNFVNYADAGGTLNHVGADAPESALIAASDISDKPVLTLVNGIGFCWSGTNDGDGYTIDYTYKSTGTGTPQASSVTVLFTIAPDPVVIP